MFRLASLLRRVRWPAACGQGHTPAMPFGELPFQLFVDVARACNLRCVMCDIYSEQATAGYSLNRTGKSELMEFGLFDLLIRQARGFITTYVLQLRGEPLLHPRFCDMARLVREKVPNASIWFNTNGLLMRPELLKQLLPVGIGTISISIDAATAGTYQAIRLGSDFDRVMKNIEALLVLREQPGLPVRPVVGVSFVLQEANRHEQEIFLERWLGKADYVQFYAKVEIDRSRPAKFFLPVAGRVPCASLWNSAAVLCDGTVTPCCGDLDPQEPLGQIQQLPLDRILREGRYQELRRLHQARHFDTIPLCRECDTWMGYQVIEEIPRPGWKVARNPLSETWTLAKE